MKALQMRQMPSSTGSSGHLHRHEARRKAPQRSRRGERAVVVRREKFSSDLAVPVQSPRILVPTKSTSGKTDGDRLAGVPAHHRIGGGGVGYPLDGGSTAGLLDRFLALEVEISRRSAGCVANCVAADSARVLRARRTRVLKSPRTLVAIFDRPHSSVHFHRTGDRFHPL